MKIKRDWENEEEYEKDFDDDFEEPEDKSAYDLDETEEALEE